ncbi:hypothetical protein LTR65_006909 [Meristemomyces frigidus]
MYHYSTPPRVLLLRDQQQQRREPKSEGKKLLILPTKSIVVNHGWESDDEEDEAKAKPISETAGQALGAIAVDLVKAESGIHQTPAAFHAEFYPHSHTNSKWYRIAAVLVFLRFDDGEEDYERGIGAEQKKKWKWMTEEEVQATHPASITQEADRDAVLLGFQALRNAEPVASTQQREVRKQADRDDGEAPGEAAERMDWEADPDPVERQEEPEPRQRQRRASEPVMRR